MLDADGDELPAGETGALVVKLPMPPGSSPTLWNADDRFREAYLSTFPGYYQTADAGYVDEDGYLFVMARTDDIINVAGHRLSTGAIEEVLASHPDVAECAVIGVADELKGQLPIGFLVLKAGVERADGEIGGEAVQLVRERIGPVAAFKTARRRRPPAEDALRARSCAARCAASPTARSTRSRRRSTTRRSSTRSATRCAAPATRDRRRLLPPAEADLTAQR